MNADAYGVLCGFVLNTGKTWGEVAEPFQHADALAIIRGGDRGERRHYLMRGRGMSKTSDAAGVALALLLSEAPTGSRSYVYAVDGDQAGIALDALNGFVRRNRLETLVEVKANLVTIKRTGATLSVETSDGASAFGLLPWLVIADELAMWPAQDNHRTLWSAIISGIPKVSGSRLVAIGTGGSPFSVGAEVWERAAESTYWRRAKNPGPSPWWTPEDVEALRADLSPADWKRLIECEFAAADDALTSPEDVAACIRPGETVLAPRAAHQYVAGLDIGTRADLSAFVIGHAETREAGRTVVIDRVVYWRPGKGPEGRVDLSEVEATALRLCREYGVERLRFDRMQAEQLTSNLARQGVRVQEYVFSTAGVNRLARSMHIALRDHAIELPDDEEVRAEATTVRLVETGAGGTVKMMNPPGSHDDVFQAIAMVLVDLTAQPVEGYGTFSIPGQIAAQMGITIRGGVDRGAYPGLPAARSGLPLSYRMSARGGPLAAVRKAQREQTEAQRRAGLGLIVPGSANDPDRVVH